MKKIANIWKKLNYDKATIGVEYFGLGGDGETYHISRVSNHPLYKWVAVSPTNQAHHYGKTLQQIATKLKGV